MAGGSHGGHGSGSFFDDVWKNENTQKEVMYDIRPDKGNGNMNNHPANGHCITDLSMVFLKLSALSNEKWLQGETGRHVKAHDIYTSGEDKEYQWILRKHR